MQNIKLSNFLWILAITGFIVSCTKTRGDAYRKYLEGGEITYPGRVDTVIAHSGLNRIMLSVVLGNDPLVTRLRVFWNNNSDSLEFPVKRTSGSDTIEVLIPELSEGDYNFIFYTYDKSDNRSVIVNATGTAIGQNYISTLTNRTLQSVTQSKDGKIVLNWGAAAAGEQGIDLSYTGSDGTERKITVADTILKTELTDYKGNSSFNYISKYKPDSNAYEFFYPKEGINTSTLPAFERELPKAGFNVLELPTDVKDGGYGWLISYLWDDNYNPPGFATQSVIPCWFTIDGGQSVTLSRFKVWQANDRLYAKESVKTFELYGSNQPAADGSWNSWTKIGSYESIKPSGLPVGQNSNDDITYAKAGEEFSVPNGTAPFRYYRFKLLSNWGNSGFMTMEEITFYTHDK
ncbi:hypothetical protein DVR12_16160 [Chitinophaga silvatica]|uniref:DUF5000 domain-containing protein n=1 Tax=Chitinophaga silvatica TaxID=2282649 RepID=A0A3E1Y8C4_9BACT|nr:DUF4998 domain-containing protein [Chitinophaga silvatica]RFS21430.1 hypothetical protein DVR12_16160 [Chitinophaga silvatica]